MKVTVLIDMLKEIKQEIARDYPDLTISNLEILELMKLKTMLENNARSR